MSEQAAKKPELLAPAGTRDALDAAIRAGADAVYFGGSRFNARMSADNFDDTAMEDAIRTCAFYGVRSNITLNTLATEREMPEVLRYAERLARFGADAIICADLGLASLIHTYFPSLELHASTQCAGHNTDAARFLASLGFSRMVAARELSFEDLRTLCADAPIETELFIHGAMCVSQSGGCLFSSLVGGRSGNRGACAQPCRLPYSVDCGTQKRTGTRTSENASDFPLSLRDNCLAAHIPQILSLGAASLKIEGRMKSPAYVEGVVRIYRRLLDEARAADAQEMQMLIDLFSRGGAFTDQYFRGTTGRQMRGIRTEADKAATVRAEKAVTAGRPVPRRIPCALTLTCTADAPMTLTASACGVSVTSTGPIPEQAITRPAVRSDLEHHLSKLGATPFFAGQISIVMDDGITVPLSALNAMRRTCTEQLENTLKQTPRRSIPAIDADAVCRAASAMQEHPHTPYAYARQASFLFCDRIPDEAAAAYDILYLPLDAFCRDPRSAVSRGVNGVQLPPVIFDSEREDAWAMLAKARAAGVCHALVSNVGHIALASSHGFVLHGDHRLNVWTAQTAAALANAPLADLLLSPELTAAQMRDVRTRIPHGAVTYGRLPMMTLQRCILREQIGNAPAHASADNPCRFCDSHPISYLQDRRQFRFPVTRAYPHRNLIHNAQPVYMADRAEELRRIRADFTHHLFTTETRAQAAAVIRAYREGSHSVPYENFPPYRRL